MFEQYSPAEFVRGLDETEPETLSDEGLINTIKLAAAVASWAEAIGVGAIANLRRRRQADFREMTKLPVPDRPGQCPDDILEVDRFCAVEVATALRITQRAATQRVRYAAELTSERMSTVRALNNGLIGVSHARALHEALASQKPSVAARVESEVLDKAGEMTPAQIGASARRLAAKYDKHSALRRCVEAREARRAVVWPQEDGMSALHVTGPAETITAAWERIDGLARAAQDAARASARDLAAKERLSGAPDVDTLREIADAVPTLDQLRADTVLRLLVGSHDLAELPAPDVTVNIDVLVPLSTLLGVSDDFAELAGYGAIPPDVARALAADAKKWRLIPLTADGTVATPCTTGSPPGSDPPTPSRPPPHSRSHGLTPYRPSEALVRAIRARDVTCRFPGCRRAARRCDVDHSIAHPEGPTAGCNLACLCRLHHRAKHRAGWQMQQLGDGRIRWTSPTGHHSTTDPPRWHPPLKPAPAATAPSPPEMPPF